MQGFEVIIALLLELVVGFEPVRPDGDVAPLTCSGRMRATGGALSRLAPALECEAHRIGMRHAALSASRMAANSAAP